MRLEPLPRPILLGKDFLTALVKAGIVPHCRRVVIDAAIDKPVKIYVDTFGHPDLLDVVVPMADAAQVVVVGGDVVHLLRGGGSLCSKEGDKSVSPNEVTCLDCLRMFGMMR